MGNDGGSRTKFCARRSSRRSRRSVLSDVTCSGDDGDDGDGASSGDGAWESLGLESPEDGDGGGVCNHQSTMFVCVCNL